MPTVKEIVCLVVYQNKIDKDNFIRDRRGNLNTYYNYSLGTLTEEIDISTNTSITITYKLINDEKAVANGLHGLVFNKVLYLSGNYNSNSINYIQSRLIRS